MHLGSLREAEQDACQGAGLSSAALPACYEWRARCAVLGEQHLLDSSGKLCSAAEASARLAADQVRTTRRWWLRPARRADAGRRAQSQ
jgi:hypothetical protein